MSTRSVVPLLILLVGIPLGMADDPVFSGPQPGETLTPFQVVVLYGEAAGKEIDPIELAGGKPTMLVFVHKRTCPGIALTRGLTSYAKSQSDAATGIVWLADDKSKEEQYLNMAKNSLNFTAPVGISVDGGEGPGAYGLNRNVELTVLIAKDKQVVANFALVQPSVTEGPRIAGELAKLLDHPAPTAEEFERLAYPGGGMKKRRAMQKKSADSTRPAGDLRSMMQKVIAAGNTEAELSAAIQAVETWVGETRAKQTQLGKMSGAVLERGMGTAAARTQIKAWREKYGSQPDPESAKAKN